MRHRNKKADKKTQGANDKSAPYTLRGRLWVDGPEGTFIGYGRVALMERIRDLGSITKAARSMKMSYRHAWELIDSMNRQAPEPFVITTAGGRNGGGTRLTKHGDNAIRLFYKTQDAFKRFLKTEGADLDYKKDA